MGWFNAGQGPFGPFSVDAFVAKTASVGRCGMRLGLMVEECLALWS